MSIILPDISDDEGSVKEDQDTGRLPANALACTSYNGNAILKGLATNICTFNHHLSYLSALNRYPTTSLLFVEVSAHA